MADASAVLDKLSAGNIFDLRGVVAVVTGGGTVGGFLINICAVLMMMAFAGYRIDDKHDAYSQWRDCLHRWSRPDQIRSVSALLKLLMLLELMVYLALRIHIMHQKSQAKGSLSEFREMFQRRSTPSFFLTHALALIHRSY